MVIVMLAVLAVVLVILFGMLYFCGNMFIALFSSNISANGILKGLFLSFYELFFRSSLAIFDSMWFFTWHGNYYSADFITSCFSQVRQIHNLLLLGISNNNNKEGSIDYTYHSYFPFSLSLFYLFLTNQTFYFSFFKSSQLNFSPQHGININLVIPIVITSYACISTLERITSSFK